MVKTVSTLIEELTVFERKAFVCRKERPLHGFIEKTRLCAGLSDNKRDLR